ncbi:MAG TPA: hypothetical protein PKD54_10590, partial [Pirellulaceae bacterium]|nr:hypothetical protein [Pirellulaceae bacterium]
GQWRELPKTTVEYALDLAQLAASLIRAELAELELDSVDQAPPDIRLRWAELADAAFDQLNWAVGQSSFDRSVLDTESRDWHPLTDDTRWDALLWDNGTSM